MVRKISTNYIATEQHVGLIYHRLHSSGSTVVTMTSKVHGKTESETPKNIETKFGANDYVIEPSKLVSFSRDQSKGVCSPNR